MTPYRIASNLAPSLGDARYRPASRWRKTCRAWRLAERKARAIVVLLLGVGLVALVASIAQCNSVLSGAVVVALGHAYLDIRQITRDGMLSRFAAWSRSRARIERKRLA